MNRNDVERECFAIQGGQRLTGTVNIGGSRSLAPAAMAAALLTQDDCFIENVPHTRGVDVMARVLNSLGATVEWIGESPESILRINAANIHSRTVLSELAIRNPVTCLLMGSLFGRFGEAVVPADNSSLDIHLDGFRALGAEITRQYDKYRIQNPDLRGKPIFMDYPDDIATENLMMAAILAGGETTIVNASCEPEVVALGQMLNEMGAKIQGAGSHTIQIEGVRKLNGTTFSLIPDRNEAGIFAVATAITHGDILLKPVVGTHLRALLWKLQQVGVEVREEVEGIRVRGLGNLTARNVATGYFPGFPSNLLPAVAVLSTQAEGLSMLNERVFDDSLGYAKELKKLGAEITIAGRTAIIRGLTRLTGDLMEAQDTYSAVAMALAGLVAFGQTEVMGVNYIDDTYPDMIEKLRGLGVNIQRKIKPSSNSIRYFSED